MFSNKLSLKITSEKERFFRYKGKHLKQSVLFLIWLLSSSFLIFYYFVPSFLPPLSSFFTIFLFSLLRLTWWGKRSNVDHILLLLLSLLPPLLLILFLLLLLPLHLLLLKLLAPDCEGVSSRWEAMRTLVTAGDVSTSYVHGFSAGIYSL